MRTFLLALAVTAAAIPSLAEAATPPGPVTITAIYGGNNKVRADFILPADDGGAPITRVDLLCGVPGSGGSAGVVGGGNATTLTVTNATFLPNGGTASCNVRAFNGVGFGPNSLATVLVSAVPDPPTGLTAAPDNGLLILTFGAPTNDGGSPVLDYTADCGSGPNVNGGSPINVFGLPNGVQATCNVFARNANGLGIPATVRGTPATVPGAPTLVSVTPGAGSVSVAFTPPASDGGSPILDYLASCNGSGRTSTTSPVVFTGLVNGNSYSCNVSARNARGFGGNSATLSATPSTVPSAPTINGVTPGNAQVTVTFTAGGNGGMPILDFTAQCGAQSVTGASSPLTVTGLPNGVAAACVVRARNVNGPSTNSAPQSATPSTVPAAPTITLTTPSSGGATVSFTPGSDGGSPILDFTAQCGTASVTGTASPLAVSGLGGGSTITCVVRARNANGTGPDSGGSSLTSGGITFSGPSPTGSGTIIATLTGGGPGCTFAPTPAFIGVTGAPRSPPAGPPNTTFPHGLFDFTLTGCTPASTITMAVEYPSTVRPGTTYYKYGPTAADPAPHWYVLPATIAGNTITFTIADGGLGDDDLAANGTIVDQGGPGFSILNPDPVPTLSEWMLMLLALLMVLMFPRAGSRTRS